MPTADCQRIIGRVFNFNQIEEDKLGEHGIGLINFNEESASQVFKMKLNMSDVKNYSLFEGEIIVAEGFLDTSASKFNVNRIFKPSAFQKQPSF
jgi:hypothetical protein